MKTIIECHSPTFSGITDPYTGEPVVVRMVVPSSGEPLFFAPDAFSPAEPVATKAQALAGWDRVDGVSGLRAGKPVRCAYTGELLHMETDERGYRLEGGFDPRRLCTRAEFMHRIHMRDGVPDPRFPAPGPVVHVTTAPEKAPVAEDEAPDISADAEETAARIVDQCADKVGIERKIVVPVPRAVRSHHKKARK